MQSETDFLANLDDESTTRKAYQYFMRVDPDMKDILGPIEEVDDPVTGRRMKKRWAKIAMVRGAKEENLKETTVYLDPFPHIRQEKGKDLQGWYSSKGDSVMPGERDRPCETDAILTQPYGGWCPVGCTFCYINSGARGYRGSGLMTVPLGYGEHVKKQLRSLKVSAAGYFSSFTDPFLPLEDYYHNTQRGAQAFVDAGLPIFFLSRVNYPGWAIDLLRKNPHSYAQKSLNCASEETWHKLSPGAISLREHLDEIRELRRLGVYTSIQCNPIIPGIVEHEEVEQLFERLAEVGNNHVIVKFVEAGHAWARAMVERITKKFPDQRSNRFRELFTENQAGGQKTIQEEYRREAHGRYQKKATALGMTYSLCYEFTKQGAFWRSMGPEFLTADQCHGHRVPMYQRIDDKAKLEALGDCVQGGFQPLDTYFEPMDVCPPSGCLRCAETHEGESLCGSDILKAGKALRLPDLRNPWNKLSAGVALKPV
jgi:DNA repair photolyase